MKTFREFMEQVEQLDEISSSLKNRYVSHAIADGDKHFTHGMERLRQGDRNAYAAAEKKRKKRSAGVMRALTPQPGN